MRKLIPRSLLRIKRTISSDIGAATDGCLITAVKDDIMYVR